MRYDRARALRAKLAADTRRRRRPRPNGRNTRPKRRSTRPRKAAAVGRPNRPLRPRRPIGRPSEDGKARYRKRKQTVEPVFGIIKSAIGFTRFRLRGLQNVAAEWLLIALAYNCRRLHNLRLA
ncbi:MAG TPA: transposase [Hyphomicrobiaceae bacterium]|nr:transposase [Hyphomicrobiaceae bacterium]